MPLPIPTRCVELGAPFNVKWQAPLTQQAGPGKVSNFTYLPLTTCWGSGSIEETIDYGNSVSSMMCSLAVN
ncbi:unnamed protein product [Clonostachys chloroleuca]|uniref:Uncharacterized protein n=1 Tax=Clonostachys chloroleuca TaxID=1926264 RepID=A0AA35Q0S0_9HYPO|nr:unnamed protein product [Clonostachys chloroleuca]